jgi:O-glycosyl hydrolase
MMRRTRSVRRTATRVLAGVSATALAVTGLVTALPAAESAAAATTAAEGVTLTPNPWYAGDPFQGWGTSLVWFANATGGYPEELREDLYQAVFGEEGLDLNIARYNIGGGNASDVVDYLRPGGAVDGWWAPDADGSAGVYGGASTAYADREAVRASFDPDDLSQYDLDADATQRWWVDRLAADDQISHWETFANSAPYFMTESGYVSGGFNSTAQQLKTASEADFVSYLTRVTEQLEQTSGIEVESIDPFNEPNTNYWGTTIRDGQPTGRQEGMHVSPDQQVRVIAALQAELAESGTTTDAFIAAMDETNPGIFATNWAAYPQATRDAVERLNVHTYGTSGRLGVRDLAKQADSPLWMSEIEGSWVNGWDPTNIENGLGMAGRVMDDLRELEPDAWVLWQPVEDLYNMEPQGEDLNWGSMFIDLDCVPFTEDGTEVWKSERRVADAGGDSTAVEPCSVEVNSKFSALRNFTGFIQEGDRLIAVDDVDTTAAVRPDGDGATLVHRNTTGADRTVTIDLSHFGAIAEEASVTPYTTTEAPEGAEVTSTGVVPGTPVAVDVAAGTATLTVPAKSVTTFEVSGVSGVAADAPAVVDGHDYQFVGVQSGKALGAAAGSAGPSLASTATTTEAAAGQSWTARAVPTESGDVRRVTLQAGDGRYLAATSRGTELRTLDAAAAAADAATRWWVTTTDGETFSFVGDGVAQSLDVGGQSTAEGAPVGVYGTNGGANQRWSVRDLDPAEGQTLAVRTDAGVPPALPATVVARYSWGSGAAAGVAWDAVEASAWQTPGRVEVTGTATDVFGQSFAVTALVDVGGLTVTDPVSLTVAVGSPAAGVVSALPETVPARVAASEQTFDVPVTWDAEGLTDADLADVGVVPLTGTATVDGGTLPARLSLIVTDSTLRNFAPDAGVAATASSTESGYPADRTRNGVSGDKGWSNWVSANKPAQSTLTYSFDAPRDVSQVAVQFYADGSAQSWAQSIQLQQRGADGSWQPLPGYETAQPVAVPTAGAPVVTAQFPTVSTSGVRVVMNAYANTHLTVSEVQLFEPVASDSSVSTAATLRVDGVEVEGFDPEARSYDVVTTGSRWPVVSAIATDTTATVTTTQADDSTDGVATVRITSPDGSTTTEYAVRVERQVATTSAVVVGEPRVGSELRVSVDVDPGDAVVAVEWSLDGEPVAPAGSDAVDDTTSRAAVLAGAFTVPAGAEGSVVTARVTATAAGFVDAEPVETAGVTILAAPVDPPVGGGDPTAPGAGGGPTAPGGAPGAAPGAGSGGAPTAGAGQSGTAPVDAAGDSRLAFTGSGPALGVVLAAALGLLVLGSALVVRRRGGRRS